MLQTRAQRLEGKRDHAGRQAAAVRKPFHHQTDDADIDNAGANSAQQAIGCIKPPQRPDIGGCDPAEAAHHRAEADQKFRTKFFNEVSLQRRQPSLQHDQKRDGPLHLGED